jgi:ATP-binding cassette subfamily C protein LapB
MGRDTPANPSQPPPHHLLANLRELMGAWFAQRENGEATSQVEREITDAAARHGLSLGFRKIKLADVPDSAFPLVLLEQGGASRLILGRVDGKTYLCHGQGARYEVSADVLEKVESGTVFFARVADSLADDMPSDTKAERIEEPNAVAPDVIPAAKAHFRLLSSPTVRDLVARMTIGNGRLLLALALTGLIGNILFIALPIFSMAVYDKVVPHNASETMIALSIGVCLALITDFGLRAVRTKLSDALALRVQVDMTVRVLRQLLRVKLQDAPRDPAAILLALRDLDGFCQILPALFISLSIDILFVLGICAFLTMLGGLVGLVPLIGLILLGIVYGISHFLAEREGEKSQKFQRNQSALVIDTIAHLETIKTHHGEAAFARRFAELADRTAFAGHRERHFGALANQAAVTIAQMMTVLAMVFSVIAIGAGNMTIGAMSAAVMIISRVMPPLSQMIGAFHRMWQLRRGIERIDLLMEAPLEEGGDIQSTGRVMRGDLALHQVSLTYRGAACKALDQVSVRVNAGERIGIVGRIGCGKTSLLRLITRLAEPSEGSVSIDGYDVRQYDPAALRRSVGLLRQDSRLVGGSPAAHLGLGLDLPEPDKVAEAIEISGAADFIKRHPKGLQMPAGAEGQLLSGGERQAIALARLILGDPRIVLLDEPTAAMDNALEAHVIKSLGGWLGDRTLIVSTHRVPVLSLVERIIVMDQGRIIADGPRDDILKRLGRTAA